METTLKEKTLDSATDRSRAYDHPVWLGACALHYRELCDP